MSNRISVATKIDKNLLEKLDQKAEEEHFNSRSEYIRHLIRRAVEED